LGFHRWSWVFNVSTSISVARHMCIDFEFVALPSLFRTLFDLLSTAEKFSVDSDAFLDPPSIFISTIFSITFRLCSAAPTYDSVSEPSINTL
jgi:hypothetical protein